MKPARDDERPESVKEQKPAPLDIHESDDDLDRFAADGQDAIKAEEATRRAARRLRWPEPVELPPPQSISVPPPPEPQDLRAWWIAGSIVLLAALGALGYVQFRRGALPLIDSRAAVTDATGNTGRPAADAPGVLSVDTAPPGAQVLVDGIVRGNTPLVLSLAPGTHAVNVVLGSSHRERPVEIRAGSTTSHFIEFAVSSSGPANAGGAGGRSDAPPLRSLPTAGTAAALAPAGTDAAAAGWVTITVPFEMQISERQTVLGTTSAPRTMLPAGRHELRLVSTALNYQTSVVVNVPAGGTARATVPVPQGTLSVNAVPWAEVSIDGKPFGPTPLGNIGLPIGTHEIVWRHPTLGERTRSTVVQAGAPARVTTDFTTP